MRVQLARLFVAVSAAAIAGAVAPPTPQRGLPGPPARGSLPIERTVYVTVLDKGGLPIAGLTAEYFAVREDGRELQVVRVDQEAGPAHVALLIDTSAFSDSAGEPYREALSNFIRRLVPPHQVALYEFGDRAAVLTPFSSDLAVLMDAIGRVSSRRNATPRLIDAVELASRDLRAASATRPVVVAVTAAAADVSTASAGSVIKQLMTQPAALHIVAMTGRTGPQGASLRSASGQSEMDRRDRLNQLRSVGEGDREWSRLLNEGTSKTNGALHLVTSVLAIGPALERVSDELLITYRLVFARPSAGPSGDLQVGLMIDEVKVRAIAAPQPAR